jgi:hypothetical protein
MLQINRTYAADQYTSRPSAGTLKMSQITTDMVMQWLNGQGVSIYSAYARLMLTSSKGPTIVRQERLDSSDSDQSSDSGSSSLPEQFDLITELINMGLLKVKDILRQNIFLLCIC